MAFSTPSPDCGDGLLLTGEDGDIMKPAPGVIKTNDTAVPRGAKGLGRRWKPLAPFKHNTILNNIAAYPDGCLKANLWQAVTLQRAWDGVARAGTHFLN